MKINVLVKGKLNPSPVTIRISAGRNAGGIAPTKIYVDPEDWDKEKGRAKKTRSNESRHELIDVINNSVAEIVSELHVYYAKQVQKPDVRITTLWLKEFVATRGLESTEAPLEYNGKPMDLLGYWDYFTKLNDKKRSENTMSNYAISKARVEKYLKKDELLMMEDVGIDWMYDFQLYCQGLTLGPASRDNYIRDIKSVCNHAKKKSRLPFEANYTEIERINVRKEQPKGFKPFYFNFDELDTCYHFDVETVVKATKFDRVQWDVVRDWLIISSETGQRQSDFFKFTYADIVFDEEEDENGEIIIQPLLNFTEEKGGKDAVIYLTDRVMEILEKHGKKFPKKVSINTYNFRIKQFCKAVGLDKVVFGSVVKKLDNGEHREIYDMYYQWELVASHIGRRNYATNWFGIIETSLLRAQTGHSSDELFLLYIGKTSKQQVKHLGKLMKIKEALRAQKAKRYLRAVG